MYPMLSIYPLIPNIQKLGISHDEPPTIYALLNSYVNFSNEEPAKIKDLAKTGRVMFFDFDYPLAEGIDKEDFECIILNHFLMRRIGYETVTAFKIALNVKLNEIMPEYNRLFSSIANWNIFSDGEQITRQLTDSRTSNNTTSNTGTSSVSTTGSNTDTSDRRYSNTPQNALSNVRDGNYVSEYNYDQDTSLATSSSTNTGSNSGTNNTTDSGNQNETIVRSPSDKIHLYSEFLKNKQNIYTMIFKDLDSLFYQII